MKFLTKIILGLVSLSSGIFGFYTISLTSEILGKNLLLSIILLLVSTILLGTGSHLLIKQELKEKIQVKLGE